jgi:KipI family sensor histidine kinase inhibitor
VWSRSVPVEEIRRLGDHALLVGVRDASAARALTRALHASRPPRVSELVGGLATVMVSFDPGTDPGELRPWLDGVLGELDATGWPSDRGTGEGAEQGGEGAAVTVACVFDGPDLAEVAEMAGCRPHGVADLVTAARLTVAAVGFSPGFAYLEGLPDELSHVPRRRRPRPVVPAGSIALANGYAAVYPSASPGGWQLIGRTAEPFFDPRVSPYARLAPGDHVRFDARTEIAEIAEIAAPPTPAADARPPERPPDPVFVVTQPGLRTVRQDGGRRGMAAIGVPAAGPADPTSFELANQLVGNPPDAVALEVTAKGPTLRCLRPTFVAVVGARPALRLQGQPVPLAQVVPLARDQVLDVGLVREGLRCYLAVAGGFVGPGLLGSCATDLLSGLGPGPIAAGDHLAAGVISPPLGDHVDAGVRTALRGGEEVVLRVVPGPHPERFVPGAFDSLASRSFTVAADSNRIGIRLHPRVVTPLLAAGTMTELDSQGTVTGAIQVPPDGDPVILLPDHATMGGYPVLAVVAAVDHGLLGQCAPGSTVALAPITPAGARVAWNAHRRRMATAIAGHYPVVVDSPD